MPRWDNSLRTQEEIHTLKREAILRAAGNLFNEKGYHNTSLEEVAKLLQISKGTLYNYVKNKQEILYEFYWRGQDIADRSVDLAEKSGLNGAGKLRMSIETYIVEVIENLGGYGLLAEIAALEPGDRKAIVERRDLLEQRYIRIIEEGVADGSIREIDRGMLLFTLVGAVQFISNWYSAGGTTSEKELARGIADLLLSGLAAPGQK